MNAMMTFPAPMAREFPRWRMQAGWASACPWWSSTPSSPGFGLSSSRRFIRGNKKVLTIRIRMERWTSFKKNGIQVFPNMKVKKVIREKRAALGKINSHEIQVLFDVEDIICNNLELVFKLLKRKLLTRCWCSSSSWSCSGSSRSQSSSQAGETSSKGACCNFYIYHGNCN